MVLMEEKLLEILEKEIQELSSKDNELRETMIAVQEGKENIQEEIIAGLLKDKKQLEEAIENEKMDYIKAEYTSDLERVNDAINNWEQTQLQEILSTEKEIESKRKEEEVLEEYKREKPQNEKYNQDINERRAELEHRKSEAEVALNELTNNGEKTFFRGQPVERNEIENDLEKISAELERINNEQENENNKFAVIETRYNDLCDKYNVKEVIEEERRQAEEAKRKEEEAKRKEEEKRKAAEEEKQKEEAKRKAEENETSKTENDNEIDEITKGLMKQADIEAEKAEKAEKADKVLQEEIDNMDDDLGSSIAKFQEPDKDKKAENSGPRAGTITSPNVIGATTNETEPKKGKAISSEEYNLDDGIDIDSERKSMEEALGSKSYKITIGKEGKVKVSGKFRSIKVDQEVYKNAAELNIYYNSLSTESFMKEIENRYDDPTISKLIRVCKENAVPIDFTVIDSINNVVDGGQKESDALIKGYMFNVLGAHYDYLDGEGKTEETKKLEKYKGIPFIDNIYLTYNLNSLSSIPLKAIGLLKENDNFGYMGKKKDTKQSWVEKTVLTSSQRDRIANLASIANQYEIADEKGTYHETILAKAIRFFNSSMKKFLPTKETIKLLNSGNIERIDESIDRKEERRRKLNENGLGHVDVEPIEVENSSTGDRTNEHVISSEKEYDD